MAYEGEKLDACPRDGYDFANTYAVIVSGSGVNKWGHMLLNVGGKGGMYMQVAMGDKLGQYTRTFPRYMNEAGYARYLKENGKKELRRFKVELKNPPGAMLRLEELLSKPYSWWGVVHNCEAFAEEIILAGGGPKIHKGPLYLPVESRVY